MHRLRSVLARHERLLLVLGSALLTLALMMAWTASRPLPRELKQEDIDAAVLHTMQEKVMPSADARATRCAPMDPLAPGTFSMMMETPSACATCGASMRGRMSLVLPGG